MKKQNSPDGRTLPPELSSAIKEMQDAKPAMTAYPWSDMEVGDSILFQAEQGENLESISTEIETSISQYSKLTGKKFSTQKRPSENGFRIWRRE